MTAPRFPLRAPSPARSANDRIPYSAGIAAAMAGGILWAVISGALDMEIGWVAWGIGGLVGLMMSKTSEARGRKVATVAAACAVLGLVVGKSLLHEYVTKPAVIESLSKEEGAAMYATSFAMRGSSSYSPAVQAELDALPEADTIPDALWAQMMAEAKGAVDAMPPAARDSAAMVYAQLSMGSVTWMQQALWHLTPFDALWILLAVSTAWSMLVKPKEAPVGDAVVS